RGLRGFAFGLGVEGSELAKEQLKQVQAALEAEREQSAKNQREWVSEREGLLEQLLDAGRSHCGCEDGILEEEVACSRPEAPLSPAKGLPTCSEAAGHESDGPGSPLLNSPASPSRALRWQSTSSKATRAARLEAWTMSSLQQNIAELKETLLQFDNQVKEQVQQKSKGGWTRLLRGMFRLKAKLVDLQSRFKAKTMEKGECREEHLAVEKQMKDLKEKFAETEAHLADFGGFNASSTTPPTTEEGISDSRVTNASASGRRKTTGSTRKSRKSLQAEETLNAQMADGGVSLVRHLMELKTSQSYVDASNTKRKTLIRNAVSNYQEDESSPLPVARLSPFARDRSTTANA
ncbi:hypothetical protein CYMTET_26293, partial [Cymbomonas tetramitiformis]